MAGSVYKMVLPKEMDSVEELDEWKDRFDKLTWDQKHALDDASMKTYGVTNMYRYIKMRKDLKSKGMIKKSDNLFGAKYKKEMDKILSEDSISSDSTIEAEEIDNLYEKWNSRLFKARNLEDSGYIFMVDTDSTKQLNEYDSNNILKLREKWNQFQGLPENKRSLYNNTAKDIFGYDNYQLYSYIMSHFTKIDTDEEASSVQRLSTNGEAIEESIISPYFTTEEMDYLDEVTYSEERYLNVIGKETLDEFMESYKVTGQLKDTYLWTKTLEELYAMRSIPHNENKIDMINESILRLGWNPEIPFSTEVAKKLHNRTKLNVHITDVTEMYNNFDENKLLSISEAAENKGLSAVFIVLLKSGSFIGNAVGKVTGSKWGHAGIAFAPELNAIYSFNGKDDAGKLARGGFLVESINRYIDDNVKDDSEKEIKIYALIVTKKERKAMTDAIKWYKEHANETRYDFIGLVRIYLGIIEKAGNNTKMVCSQFVYFILSLAKKSLNDNHKDGSLITPADIDNLKKELNFYYVYDGHPKKYNPNRTAKLVENFIAMESIK